VKSELQHAPVSGGVITPVVDVVGETPVDNPVVVDVVGGGGGGTPVDMPVVVVVVVVGHGPMNPPSVKQQTSDDDPII